MEITTWQISPCSDVTEFSFYSQKEKDFFDSILDDFHSFSPMIKKWGVPIMVHNEPKRFPHFFEIAGKGIWAVSQKGFEAMKNSYTDNLEFLPFRTDLGDFYAINILNPTSCLNIAACEAQFLPNGQIVTFSSLDFLPNKIPPPIINF